MLSKLFKYELKATARFFIPLYFTILIFAAINRFVLPMYSLAHNQSVIYGFATAISMIIYVTLMIGLVVMTLIVMVQRFYKNLLGDEGYLMFTLPVQSEKHIFSKLTISTLWIIVSGIVAMLSILIIMSQQVPLSEIFGGLAKGFGELAAEMGGFSFLAVIEMIILGLLSIASTVLTIYAAIALGHLFNKYKLLISFGMYIVLKTASEVLMFIFALTFGNIFSMRLETGMLSTSAAINTVLLLAILYFAIITVGYFVLTNYILKKKLNLE